MTDRMSYRHVSGQMRSELALFRWYGLVLAIVAGLILPAGARAATPYANTLNDLCPGTPDPCIVAGKFMVSDGFIFDVGGRSLQLTASAKLDGQGGSFAFINAASVTLDKGSQLLANIKGGGAGTISIDSAGFCALNGKIQANGSGDSANEVGGEGGALEVSCSDITVGPSGVLEAKGAGITVDGYPIAGGGGQISLTATSGAFAASKGSKFEASGKGDVGGEIDVEAAGACALAGAMKADAGSMRVPDDVPMGGDGGTVSLSCADVTLNDSGKITAGSVKTAMSGAVSLTAASGSVTMEKGSKIVNDGSLGDASAIEVTAPGACTLSGALQSKSGLYAWGSQVTISCDSLTVNPSFVFDGSNTGGTGGSLGIDVAGACTLAGDANVKSSKGSDAGEAVLGAGGSIDITCGDTLTQTKDSALDASGSGGNDTDGYSTAGAVAVTSTNGAVSLGGKLLASSSKGGGGSVSVVGIGVTTTPDSKLEAKGGAVNVVSSDDTGTVSGDVSIGKTVAANGGTVSVEGCNVTVGLKGELTSTDKVGGTTTVLAHKALAIDGKVLALSSTSGIPEGTNVLKYRDSYSVLDPKKIQPATTPEQDLTLSACP